MSFPISEFWKLAVDSQVLSSEECRRLAAQFGQMNGAAGAGDCRKLSEWLVSQRVLSRYQASLLLARRPGPFIYGDYRLQDRIESGRLTGLFRAVHVPTRQPVCLQFLAGPGLQDPQALARLALQMTALGSVQHAHVARVYQLVDLPNYKFVVVADLQGRSLAEHLATCSHRPTPAEACRLVRQAALGLAQLHQAGQIHGELRPTNLWVDQTGGLKVLPLPLARDPLSPPTVPHAPGIKPEQLQAAADYLAPELATPGRWPDARSDVYALGCLLYELLARRAPFADGDWQARLRRHASEQPQPLNQLNPQVPGPVAQVVGYLMGKDPAARYQQMQHVAEALLPYLDPAAAKSVEDSATPMSRAYDEWLKKSRPVATPTAVRAMPAGVPMAQPAQAAIPQAAYGQTPHAQPVYGSGVAGAFPGGGYGGMAIATPVMAAPVGMHQPQAVAAQPAVAVQSAPSLPNFGVTAIEAGQPGVAAARRAQRKAGGKGAVIVWGVVASVALVASLAVFFNLPGKDDVPPEAVAAGAKGTAASTAGSNQPGGAKTEGQNKTGAGATKPLPTPEASTGEPIIGLDNEPIWESPTSGAPLDLNYFPSSVRVYVALRPADIWRNDEAKRVLAAVGIEESLRQRLIKLGGTPIENMEQAIFGFGGAGPHAETYLVVRAKAALEDGQMRQTWGVQEPLQIAGKTVYRAGNVTLYAPPEEQNKLTVAVEMADEKMLESWLASPKTWPPMREFEPLIRTSDASRMLTVLFAPRYFNSTGKSLFAGPAERLYEPLLSFLTDGAGLQPPAGAFSLHLSPDLFAELRIYGDPESQPAALAKDFRKKVQELPTAITRYKNNLDISPYSRPVLGEYPGWIRILDDYTRAGTNDKQVVLRSYLPPLAAHNLAFGTQLALLESPGAGGTTVAAPPQAPKTLAEKLKQKYTLVFDRDSLERTLDSMSKDTGIPITILGGDLQLEGITKNQSFGLDEKDKPVFEILKTIMKKANPDGKLVYVIRNEGGREGLFITTRAGVAKRGEKIPPELE